MVARALLLLALLPACVGDKHVVAENVKRVHVGATRYTPEVTVEFSDDGGRYESWPARNRPEAVK